ncbi:MAG TPA: apolipoprotein N-acyltransferase [Nostocaceae cyanobacterium]|nr:apolipoprotein N-acyltransferase [Nostocaceae cyanobacterium]
MGLTVAPVNAWFLAWFALAPLWVLIVQASEKSGKTKPKFLLLPFLWAIAYHGLALFWITGIHPMDWLGVPWLASLSIAAFCLGFISAWGGLLVCVWANLWVRLHQSQPALRVLLGVALWCGLEHLWSLGSLWWTSLSYTQSPHNLVILHLGQISGPSAVTAVIVAVNGLIAEAWLKWREKARVKWSAIALSLFIISHFIGFSLYIRPLNQTADTALKVGIIQGNIPNPIKLKPEGFRRALQNYTQGYLTLANQNIAAVLTPEGALPIYSSNLNQTPLLAAIQEKGIITWLGAYGEKGKSYTNSLFTITGNGEIVSRYDKFKLVPLGEFIPFEEILGKIIQRLSPLDAHLAAGETNQTFDTPLGRAIVGICYESAFAEIFRQQAAAGGEFILSAANDAHYAESMPAQHHAQDIMRAIETDRWAVRATNTGYSAFVNPHGQTIWISGHNTYETHAETIYPQTTKTLYVRWGDWLLPLLLGLSGVGWVFVKLERNKGVQ